jgi:hypothetical protein
MDELEPETKRFAAAWSQTQGITLQELSECGSSVVVCVYRQAITRLSVEEFGTGHRRDIVVPLPSDLATICYTSVSSVLSGATFSSAKVIRTIRVLQMYPKVTFKA